MEKRDSQAHALAALTITGLVFIIYIWDRVALPIFLVEIRAAYGFSLPSAGLLASVFTFGLALTTVVAGVLVARFGMRQSLVASTILFSVSTGYVAIGFSFPDLVLARVLGGIGEGIYIIALLSYLGTITERYRGAAMGLPGTLFGIGLFAAPTVLAFLGLHAGWRGAFIVLMVMGLIGAAGLAGVTRGVAAYAVKRSDEPITAARIRRVFTPYVITLTLVMGVNGIAIYGVLSVLIAYLREAQHLDVTTAGFIYGLNGIGAIIGGVPIGFVADRIGRRVVMPILALVAAASGAALFAAPSSPLALGALTLVFGISANAIYVICFALARDRTPASDGPLVIGLIATVYYLLGAFSGGILATISGAFGWPWAGVIVYLIPYSLAILVFWGVGFRTSRPLA